MKTIRQYVDVVGTIERGDAAHDLTREIDKVLEALRDAAGPKSKAKGSVTLKLDFVVEGVNVEIEADISSKVPKIKRARTFMFLTQDGQLSTEHPHQPDMFIREAAKG